MDLYSAALGISPSAPPPAARKSADPYSAALGVSAPQTQTPSFKTNDPLAMRRDIEKSGDKELLKAFDYQFPNLAAGTSTAGAGRGMAPASAYQQPQQAQAQPDRSLPVPHTGPGDVPFTEPPEVPLWKKAVGVGEAAANVVSGVSGIPGATYEPVSDLGKEYLESFQKSKLVGSLPAMGALAETGAMMSAMPAAARAVGDEGRSLTSKLQQSFSAPAPTPRIEPTLPKPLYRQVNGQWQQVEQPTPAPNAAPAKVEGIPFDAEPQVGGMPKQVSSDRASVLKRIGLEDVRTSAVTGDKAQAGIDAQMARFTGEPAGLAAKAQFDAERQALVNHGEATVSKTGGTLGLDQDALNLRGQAIARPFDSLRQWFNDAKGALYKEAATRSQGAPVVQPTEVESLLNDRSFNNSAMAQDKGNLVQAIKNQLELFKSNNPQGLTVANTEAFNQWLNQNWSPANSKIIGQVRQAMDTAVTKSAGSDIYAQARQLHALEKQTLDNPNGIAKLMDFDPQTPINRVTPYDKIPDTVTRLPPAQLKNVLDTLDKMPKELQPQAQAARAEIQAQYANKMLDAGANNKGQWNAKKVSDFRNANNANIDAAFSTNPEARKMLDDLQSAGHILSYPDSYPGAAAQAQQAFKRGLMSNMTQKAGSFVGGGLGSLVGGAPGAAVGAGAGEAIGARAGQSMAEKAAVKKWNSGITKLSDFPQ